MSGMIFGCLFGGQATHYFNVFRSIGAFCLLWIFGAIACGVSPNIYLLLASRIVIGIGVGGTKALWPAVIGKRNTKARSLNENIDQLSPPQRRGLWMALFFAAAPVGVGCGSYVGVGLSSKFGWRGAFIGVGLMMIPVALSCFLVNPHITDTEEYSNTTGNDHNHSKSRINKGTKSISILRMWWDDIKVLLSHKIYRISVAGCAFYMGVIGVIAYWLPRALETIFVDKNADLWIGVVGLLSGIIGTMLGGIILDLVGSTIRNAFLIQISASLACALTLIPSSLMIRNFYVFLVVITISLSFQVMIVVSIFNLISIFDRSKGSWIVFKIVVGSEKC